MNAIDKIIKNNHLLKNLGRIGLVVNQTSVSSKYISTCEIVDRACQMTTNASVVSIFGPQHGYFQTEQDNMQETPDTEFEFSNKRKVPLYSLYSECRIPTKNQLENLDTLVVDLQDIGCRVYTYMLTLAGCLRAAAEHKKKVVVLDRPNPLGLCYFSEDQKKWLQIEGNMFKTQFNSFVGWYEMPFRHGLTMGELGKYFIFKDKLNLDYEVITVDGLCRRTQLDEFKNGPWTMPSPNIPNFVSAFLFPTFVCLEGTNVSEGRGTTLPFQLIGAPWLNNRECIDFLENHKEIYMINSKLSSGLIMREHYFRPTFNKYKGEICKGIQFHVDQTENLNLYKLGLCFLYFCQFKHPREFQWSQQKYEYNFVELPINLIYGTDEIHKFFTSKNLETDVNDKNNLDKFKVLCENLDNQAQIFAQDVKSFFIYE